MNNLKILKKKIWTFFHLICSIFEKILKSFPFSSLRKNKYFFLSLFGLLGLLAFFLLFFQNCSDINISPSNQVKNTDQLALTTKTQLPPPEFKAKRMRLVIFLDQSHSMIWQKCPEDLDGSKTETINDGIGEDTRAFPKCHPPEGIDQKGDRFSIVKEWLNEIEALPDGKDEDAFQVAIIPFSGGKTARPSKAYIKGDVDQYKKRFVFQNLSNSRSWLENLKTEQSLELKYSQQKTGVDPLYMGTSVPYPTLKVVTALMKEEMKKLQDIQNLDSTPFRFIYISDGVFRPLDELYDKARGLINCPKNRSECSLAKWKNHRACNPPAYQNPPTSDEFCFNWFEKSFIENLGAPTDNHLENIVSELKNILVPGIEFKGAKVYMDLVQLFPDRIPPEDWESPKKNIFDEVYTDFSKNRLMIGRHQLTSTDLPFKVSNLGLNNLTYKIDQFYVLNMNAFINQFGELATDSDGDGLSDKLETQNNLNPQAIRSNAYCLDSLFINYGCRSVGCENTYDKDGDGLNECEEKTIGTDPLNADTEGDNIIDIHELLRGLNFRKNQSQDSLRGEAPFVHDLFYMGLLPQVDIRKVPEYWKIKINVNEGGFSPSKNSLGSSSLTGIYDIKVTDIPLSNTLASQDVKLLIRNPKTQRLTDKTENLGPGSHQEGVNEILILVKASAYENPESNYWLFYRTEINFNQAGLVDIDFRKFKQLDLLISKPVQGGL